MRSRNINDVIHQIPEFGVAFRGDGDDFALASSNLLHVGNDAFIGTVFKRQRQGGKLGIDQRDRPVLHLARGIALGVNVGDFLEFQRAFQGNGVLELASDEKEMIRVAILFRQLANFPCLLQDFTDLLRHLFQRPDDVMAFFVGKIAAAPDEQRHEGEDGELRGEGFGGGDPHLNARVGINSGMSFAGDGAAHHIHQSQHQCAFALGLTQSGERVRRFS